MKITYIVPGFGGTFYCGNCLRDSTFSKALQAIGHESVTLPLYLPHSIEEFSHQAEIPVFYGAVNIYIKQNFKFLRNIPKWLYTFLNSSFILKYAAKKSGSTRAKGLEEMTISMLKGAEGFQKFELNQLIHYLKQHEKPDVVHLSNALLMGIAGQIKEQLNIPVFCSLQDEDVWIDAMSLLYQPKLWKLMSEKVKDIDAFIAVSHYFKNSMQQKMNIPEEKLHVIHLGIDPALYQQFNPAQNPQRIGYLSRLNEENGFGLVIEAFIKLKQNEKFKTVKLIVTGGKTKDDEQFIDKQKKLLQKNNLLNDIEFIEEFKTDGLPIFFNKITLLSVPVLKGEAFGLYQLEALASGIPIVQPMIGAFPEIIDMSNAGVTYTPNTSDQLAKTWATVLSDNDKLNFMSKNGYDAAMSQFNIHHTTKLLVNHYQVHIEKKNNNI